MDTDPLCTTARVVPNHIAAGHLYRVLTAVLPHAGTDGDDRVDCVRVEVTNSHVVAVATDRYTMAIARHPVKVALPRRGVTFTRDSIERLSRVLLAAPDAHIDLVQLLFPPYEAEEAEEVHVTVADSDVCVDFDSAAFPDWRRTVEAHLDAEADPAPVGINPRFLRRLSDIAPLAYDATGRQPPLGVHLGTSVVCTVGDWFLAVIAQRRTQTAVTEVARDIIAAPTTTAPAAQT